MLPVVRAVLTYATCGTLVFLACEGQAKQAQVVREPAVAGGFYSANAGHLTKAVDSYLVRPPAKTVRGPVLGLIVPHAGYQYSGPVAGKGFAFVKGKTYEVVVVVAPSHVESFAFASVFNGDAYRTPLGELAVDKDLASRIASKADLVQRSPKGHLQQHLARQEHSLEVELPFLQRALKPGFKLVPIVMGSQQYRVCEQLGQAIASACKGRNALVVASTDLSHFHTHKKAAQLDKVVIESVKKMNYFKLAQDIEKGRCEACGAGPMIAVMIACQKLGATQSTVVDYATSGDVPPFDKQRVVGYMAAVLTSDPSKANRTQKPMEISEKEKGYLLDLARKTIQARTAGQDAPSPEMDSPLLSTNCGAFVTLHKQGQLRGCIGYIEAYKPLGQTIVEMAESAALRDPRFPPVRAEEVADLDIEISVLTPLEAITDVEQIQVGTHGIVMERGMNRGLLLPQVATEQGWDRDTFLSHTCLKAGLPADAWQDDNTTIKIFSANVFGEKELAH